MIYKLQLRYVISTYWWLISSPLISTLAMLQTLLSYMPWGVITTSTVQVHINAYTGKQRFCTKVALGECGMWLGILSHLGRLVCMFVKKVGVETVLSNGYYCSSLIREDVYRLFPLFNLMAAHVLMVCLWVFDSQCLLLHYVLRSLVVRW